MRDASAASVTPRAISVAAIVALPTAWLDGGTPLLQPGDAWAIAYVGVVTAGVAYPLFSQALRHISVAAGVTLALGEPVMTFVLAVLVVDERPFASASGGLLLVIVGVLIVVRAESRTGALPLYARATASRTKGQELQSVHEASARR